MPRAPTPSILTGRTVDPYNPKVVRATTGSLFHLPVARRRRPRRPSSSARTAPGCTVIAADVKGDDLLAARGDGLLAEPTAWLFGNEARGLDDESLALADRALRLPIYGARRVAEPRDRRERLPLRERVRAARRSDAATPDVSPTAGGLAPRR